MEEGLKNVLTRIMKNIVDGKIEVEPIKCKYCCSTLIWKYGLNRKKIQRYYCPNCDRVFLDNDALPRMSISVKQLGDILGQYYGGMSLKELRRQFQQQHNEPLSRSSFDRWLNRFSKVALDEAQKYHPKVGDKWIADECVLKIGGKKVWCWDIIDSDSRFLLATHLSLTRTSKDAQILLEKASKVANKIPKIIITDSLNVYIDGIELAYGSEAPRHIQSQPFTEADISTNKIERWHSTLKTRTEIMRGLKSVNSAQDFLDAWLVHYNYFRPHESLNEKTPGEEAGVKFPFKDWLDVVESKRITISKPIEAEIKKLPVEKQMEHYRYPTYKGQVKRKVKRIKRTKQHTKQNSMTVTVPRVTK